MRTEEHLEELDKEINSIKWYIIELSKMRLPGEKTTILKSGHSLYQKNIDTNHHLGGVRFLVNRRIKHMERKLHTIYVIIKLRKSYKMQKIRLIAFFQTIVNAAKTSQF